MRLARRLAPAIVGCLWAGSAVLPALAASPTGVWLTEDGRARIRTEMCGPKDADLCGYDVWAKTVVDDDGKPFLDKNNPDPKKRSRPLLGHQLILGLKPADEGHFAGKIYNADNGKFYDVEVWSEDADTLTVKGCMLAVFCGSQSWTRVKDTATGQLVGATNQHGGPKADPEWAPKPAK